jgi:Baseplate J-like protein
MSDKQCQCATHHTQLPCGCCEGVEILTPAGTANRPGLGSLAYRIGVHSTFLETMKARISSLCLGSEEDCRKGEGVYPLDKLKVREAGDPAIAMLDAWATVADVMTFYQERIANEGYLRTATERRSILELARLVGYALRPGVASTAYLAWLLDDKFEGETTIPQGTLARSTPGPGEDPQAFETSEPIKARAAWNALRPRVTQPQRITLGATDIYLRGTATRLQPGDRLLIVFGSGTGQQELRRVEVVEAQFPQDRTRIKLYPMTSTLSLVAGRTAERERVRAIVARFSDVETFDLKRGNRIVRAVLKQLESIEAQSRISLPDEELFERVDRRVAELRTTHAGIREEHVPLKSWAGGLIAELESWRSEVAAIDSTPAGEALVARLNGGGPAHIFDRVEASLPAITRSPGIPPANRQQLRLNLEKAFALEKDGEGRLPTSIIQAEPVHRLLGVFQPVFSANFTASVANVTVEDDRPVEVYALRLTVSLFGHNAPRRPSKFDTRTGQITETGEWPVVEAPEGAERIKHEKVDTVHLDAGYSQILPDSWIVVETALTAITKAGQIFAKAGAPHANLVRAKYGLNGKTTRIVLVNPSNPSGQVNWITVDLDDYDPDSSTEPDFTAVRSTIVYAQSERLDLAEAPIEEDIGLIEDDGEIIEGSGKTIELDGYFDGLEAGRWLVVSGERADIPGVISSELMMLSDVSHGVRTEESGSEVPGDTIHTTLTLGEKGLAYRYRRDTVKINANVAKATNGETRQEILGSGDGSKPLQQFTLKQPPLTFVSASNPSGVESTLKVYVNDVQWHETDTLAGLSRTDRRFIARADDEAKTTITFGNGREGARLPSGIENLRATYRFGIGRGGNVRANQINVLGSRPLGVKEVINPLPATGGADRESRDQARKNAPLAVMALDRLVSTQDYADFARTFAGIGKASAARLSDGRQEIVHLTIAGAGDIPIDASSDLFRNLQQALRLAGDPFQPFQVAVRELILLVISANVRIHPDHLWEKVEAQVRAALLDAFSFERRELGQDALLSEAISVMQRVPGVEYVDVDVFGGVPELRVVPVNANRDMLRPISPSEITVEIDQMVAAGAPAHRVKANLAEAGKGLIRPAQLAYLTPEVPATLILNEVKV